MRVIEIDHNNLVKFCYRHSIATENGVSMDLRVAEFYQQGRVSKHQVLVALAKCLSITSRGLSFCVVLGVAPFRIFALRRISSAPSTLPMPVSWRYSIGSQEVYLSGEKFPDKIIF
jgi:hypothetical protein